MKKIIFNWGLALAMLLVAIVSPLVFAESASADSRPPIYTEIVTIPTEPIEEENSESEPVVEITIPVTEPETQPETEPTQETEPEPTQPTYPDEVNWYGDYRVEAMGIPTTSICGEEVDRDFLAKMLYAEAGGMGWWGQVYTCSAILNHCEVSNMTLWKCGHNANHFAVAPYVDSVTPTEMNYEVVDYVLNGGRIAEIAYFRTSHYHRFGTPVCQVDGHYFSK